MHFEDLLSTYSKVYKIKSLKRAGWVNHQINNPESVGDHSFGLSIISVMVASHLDLDMNKIALMSIFHDFGESIIGDIITPKDKAGEDQKYKDELTAIRTVLSGFNNKEELLELWLDFEHGRTKEGKFVKEMDKIEMCLQALEYETEQGVDLSEFFDHTQSRLSIPELLEIFASIKQQRP